MYIITFPLFKLRRICIKTAIAVRQRSNHVYLRDFLDLVGKFMNQGGVAKGTGAEIGLEVESEV